MLDDLADYVEAEMEIRADIRSAVLYPCLVLSTLFVGMSILIFFVVPRFAVFYSSFKAELPLPTRSLIALSNFIQSYGPWVAGGAVLLTITTVRLQRILAVRAWRDRTLQKIPIVGRMIETATTLQIARMLQLITRAGLPLLEGLETIAAAVRNAKSRADLREVAAGIATGATLAEGLDSARCLPIDARQIIATGEQTGTLNQACGVVAQQYKKELRYLTKNMSTFIEPLLTLFLAVVVLYVALAAFLPMWEMARVVKG
jgi:type II secretory pathway component PulF